ncbi:hypothetical protein Tco_1100746 [Tanacetum coccineum]
MINSHLEQPLNDFMSLHNIIEMDDLELDDQSVDTPLVSPFSDSDDESDDSEVLNDLDEYGIAGNFYLNRIITSLDGEDLAFPCMIGFRNNYGVTCKDEAKRRNSGTKTKTFEENCYLLLYAISSKEDMAYQRQLITRIRVIINSQSSVSLFTYTPYAQLVISQRYEVNVIDGN